VAFACVGVIIAAVPAAFAASQKGTTPQKRTTPKKAAKATAPGDIAIGRRVYIQFCGKCHALKAVGAKGTLGPNLDQDKVSFVRVVTAIEEGVGGIQAEYVLQHVTFNQVYDVARFVVAKRAAGGTAGEND
jgi:mono/diheme cytochrome c family protein